MESSFFGKYQSDLNIFHLNLSMNRKDIPRNRRNILAYGIINMMGKQMKMMMMMTTIPMDQIAIENTSIIVEDVRVPHGYPSGNRTNLSLLFYYAYLFDQKKHCSLQ